eukprot:TRINITY_DN9226_c1_g1_i1.p1 TRINITY_DN9226_c1_g1~~TRINITY_DN9226_c1_g1_i1.p1  ORF type:complete len:238 (+),score=26.21 TRINITY_DN9226_c1_g1_i1:62-775(+)
MGITGAKEVGQDPVYQELLIDHHSRKHVVRPEADNWVSLPPEAVYLILFHLDVTDLGRFMCTSKYNLALVDRRSSFWINFAQEKYWDDLGSLSEPSEKSPLFYKTRFMELHSRQLDTINPTRVARRREKESQIADDKSQLVADVWYFCGLCPFWEALFFMSLISFFIFLPVYLDKMIPGLELFHVMLFLIIPYLQVGHTYFSLSLPLPPSVRFSYNTCFSYHLLYLPLHRAHSYQLC